MAVVPASTPVIIPLLVPMVATVVLLLVHEPPDVALLSVVVRPTHTLVVPEIAAGRGFTVSTVVAIQPVARV